MGAPVTGMDAAEDPTAEALLELAEDDRRRRTPQTCERL